MTTLSIHASERSTFIITVSFTDEAGTSVTPKSATWTLSDRVGTVINSRQNVVISDLSSSVDIVLSGEDLAVTESADVARFFTVHAVYDSDVGSDLPLTAECAFIVDNFVNV